MNRMKLLPVLALGLLAPCFTAGQNPAPPKIKDATKVEVIEIHANPAHQQMGEDVEIMRRLLNQGLRRAEVLAVASSPDGKRLAHLALLGGNGADGTVILWDVSTGTKIREIRSAANSAVPEAEGTYLKGHGVVYTVTLPLAKRHPTAAGETNAAPRPISDWERTRGELRGKPLKEDAVAEKGPVLADVVLKMLADNGRHFSQVSENESLTVIITFRRLAIDGSQSNVDLLGQKLSGFLDLQVGDQEDVSETAMKLTDYWAGRQLPASDQEVLGDLHMKQGKRQDAFQAYAKALKQDPNREALLLKLAQARLAEGHIDQAEELLKKIRELRAKATGAAESRGAPAPAILPAKLTVSATKKLLDQVGAGKISFEEFKKAATVEYLTFPPPSEKK